jgi:hypothetical protein
MEGHAPAMEAASSDSRAEEGRPATVEAPIHTRSRERPASERPAANPGTTEVHPAHAAKVAASHAAAHVATATSAATEDQCKGARRLR